MKEKPTKRLWMPRCRAETMRDKRTRRDRTRGDKFRKIMKEQ